MITIHHLGISRSERIIWLAEELGLEYQIVKHDRAADFRAPESLWAVHPMGKSPVIEYEGNKVFESGAIIEYLLERCDTAEAPLKPDNSSQQYINYLQWMHASESTLMLPIMIKFLSGMVNLDHAPLNGFVDGELQTLFTYINDILGKHDYIAGDAFTGADIMVAYPLMMADGMQASPLAEYPAISAYIARLRQRPAYQRAAEKF